MRELSRLEYSSSEDKINIVLFFGCASEQFNISFILLANVLYPILLVFAWMLRNPSFSARIIRSQRGPKIAQLSLEISVLPPLVIDGQSACPYLAMSIYNTLQSTTKTSRFCSDVPSVTQRVCAISAFTGFV